MLLNFNEYDSTLLISIEGELDHHTSEIFKDQIDESVKGRKYDKVILNMKRLNFMDSSGIGVLIGRYKTLKSMGIDLAVVNVNSQVRKIFEISGLFKIIRDEGELK